VLLHGGEEGWVPLGRQRDKTFRTKGGRNKEINVGKRRKKVTLTYGGRGKGLSIDGPRMGKERALREN